MLVLEFLASAVRADASRLEAEPACCAVSTLTLTHPELLVGLYRNPYTRAQAITKWLFVFMSHASELAQDFISTSVNNLTVEKIAMISFCKHLSVSEQPLDKNSSCVRDQQILAVLPPEKKKMNN